MAKFERTAEERLKINQLPYRPRTSQTFQSSVFSIEDTEKKGLETLKSISSCNCFISPTYKSNISLTDYVQEFSRLTTEVSDGSEDLHVSYVMKDLSKGLSIAPDDATALREMFKGGKKYAASSNVSHIKPDQFLMATETECCKSKKVFDENQQNSLQMSGLLSELYCNENLSTSQIDTYRLSRKPVKPPTTKSPNITFSGKKILSLEERNRMEQSIQERNLTARFGGKKLFSNIPR